MRSHSAAPDSINLFDAARRRAEELRGEARDRIFDAAAEAQARQARLGLWSLAPQPVEPRVFRKRHGSCH